MDEKEGAACPLEDDIKDGKNTAASNKKKANRYLHRVIERSHHRLEKVQDGVVKACSTSVGVAKSSSFRLTQNFKSKFTRRVSNTGSLHSSQIYQSAVDLDRSVPDEEPEIRCESAPPACRGVERYTSSENVTVDQEAEGNEHIGINNETQEKRAGKAKKSKKKSLLWKILPGNRSKKKEKKRYNNNAIPSGAGEYDIISDKLVRTQVYETGEVARETTDCEYVDMQASRDAEYVIMKLDYVNIPQFGHAQRETIEVQQDTTKHPGTIKHPEITKRPDTTEHPDITKPLGVTKEPDITTHPNITKRPDITNTPDITKSSDVPATSKHLLLSGHGTSTKVDRPRLETPEERERLLVPYPNDECEDFYQTSVEELSDCLNNCGLSSMAELCEKECLDGEFFRYIEKTKLKQVPFEMTQFHVVKLAKVICGWRPKRSVEVGVHP